MSTFIWQEVGRLTVHQAGCSIGDDQRGREYDRRFWRQHDDGSFTVITDAYGVVRDEANREYSVINATEYLRCWDRTDPGGTEISSDYRYSDPVNYAALTSLRAAEALARSSAELWGAEAYEDYAGHGVA